MEQLGKKTQELLDAAVAEQKKDVERLGADLRSELGEKSKAWESIQKQLDEIRTEQKKQVDYEAKADRPLNVQLKEALTSKDFNDAKKDKSRPYVMVLKANDITNANSITNTIPAPFIVPGISESPYRQPFLRGIVTVFNPNSPTFYW